MGDAGAGRALVAVHGLPGSGRDFRWLGSAVEGSLRLVRIDLPGFGDTPLSTWPKGSFEALGDFLAALVHALELDRPILVGHSMGGVVATAAAARHPDAFAGLALVSSVGTRPHRLLRSWRHRELIGRVLAVPGASRLLLPSLRAALLSAGFPQSTPDQALLRTARLAGTISFERHRANLARNALPTMVAWAEDDPLVEQAISEELYWTCPSGPRISFETGGHNIQKTRAVELGEALVGWAEQLDPPSRTEPPGEE